jgi:serine/threonine protein kinase
MVGGERSELRGQIIEGRYRVGARIGIGGTGVVFEAERIEDGASVVIKTLRPCFVDHPDLGRRLRREAEVSRNVGHAGIVPVFDEGTLDDGSPYIVMDRVHGESLSKLLLRRGTLTCEETSAIAIRVCSVLHASHQQGYVHRDVKPEHVILDRDEGGNLVVHLLDFGVCSSPTAPADEREREDGRVFGTPSYVSPEQASGHVDIDGRADLFSLGILIFECLTGKQPFRASNVSNLLLRIIREDAPMVDEHCVEDLPPGFSAVVQKCLARDVDSRFASARAVARALVSYAEDRVAIERYVASNLRLGSRSAPPIPTLHDIPTFSRSVAA